jgi:hypothetical protein
LRVRTSPSGLLTSAACPPMQRRWIPFRNASGVVWKRLRAMYRCPQSAAPRLAPGTAGLRWAGERFFSVAESISFAVPQNSPSPQVFPAERTHGFRQCFHSRLQHRLCGVRVQKVTTAAVVCGFLSQCRPVRTIISSVCKRQYSICRRKHYHFERGLHGCKIRRNGHADRLWHQRQLRKGHQHGQRYQSRRDRGGTGCGHEPEHPCNVQRQSLRQNICRRRRILLR